MVRFSGSESPAMIAFSAATATRGFGSRARRWSAGEVAAHRPCARVRAPNTRSTTLSELDHSVAMRTACAVSSGTSAASVAVRTPVGAVLLAMAASALAADGSRAAARACAAAMRTLSSGSEPTRVMSSGVVRAGSRYALSNAIALMRTCGCVSLTAARTASSTAGRMDRLSARRAGRPRTACARTSALESRMRARSAGRASVLGLRASEYAARQRLAGSAWRVKRIRCATVPGSRGRRQATRSASLRTESASVPRARSESMWRRESGRASRPRAPTASTAAVTFGASATVPSASITPVEIVSLSSPSANAARERTQGCGSWSARNNNGVAAGLPVMRPAASAARARTSRFGLARWRATSAVSSVRRSSMRNNSATAEMSASLVSSTGGSGGSGMGGAGGGALAHDAPSTTSAVMCRRSIRRDATESLHEFYRQTPDGAFVIDGNEPCSCSGEDDVVGLARDLVGKGDGT